MIPRATYRLQFHAGFTFADAEAQVPYLDRLGISHVYASPITTAARGSTHGYDVVDPTRINPELGGEAGFRALVAALRARGMGVIVDIVPNHMGVAGGGNAWWTDVLAKGQASAHARVFDIDWSRRIVLPVLGTPLPEALAKGDIAVARRDGLATLTLYGEAHLPIRDEDQAVAETLPLAELLARQHYRLAWWRAANDELNWRRFFTINDLAGVRVEDPAVFDATHALILRLYAEELIDGVRVDHIDGLTDPAGYGRRLRAALDAIRPGAWFVVEKILADGEPLATDWGIDGTSGYDFMEQASALLHAPEGAAPLAALWHETSGRAAAFAPEALLAKRQLLAWQFAGQLDGCVAAFAALAVDAPSGAGLTAAMLRRAIERMLWVFPVYRTYGTGSAAPVIDAPIRDAVRAAAARFTPPGEGGVVDMVLAWLAGTGDGDAALAAEAVRRFQQLAAPIAAKAVEDTAFYRYGRLLSRNDVGFDAARMSLSVADFHTAMVARAQDWPHAMLTTATHDHKRGEDTRARLAVLSARPALWREHVARWAAIAETLGDGIDPGDRYMLFQSLLGAWPAIAPDDDFADRIVAWQEKALREAKLRSSWEAPDEAYETRCADLARALVTSPAFHAAMADLLEAIAADARANTRAQTALRYTVPGIPDLYQGSDLLDLSLVDPDNRRPVDFARRAALLETGDGSLDAEKIALIADLLALRRADPVLFRDGAYRPAVVDGPGAEHIVAFTRASGERRLDLAVVLHGAQGAAETTIRFDGMAPVAAAQWLAGQAVHYALRES